MATHFDRLFFAIIPDEQAAEHIAAVSRYLRSQHRLTRKPMDKNRYHVSLHHAGDYPALPEEMVAVAERAAASVVFPVFQIAFDKIVSVKGKQSVRPVVLTCSRDNSKLMLFQKMLGVTLKLTCLRPWVTSWRFKPHLTLLYDDCEANRNIDTIEWTVREFVLVHSLVGQTQYRLLKRFPLQATQS